MSPFLSRRRLLLCGIAAPFLPILAATAARAANFERIVTLGGDITEIVFALGEGARIVGRDSTSVYPEAVFQLPDVGYVRQLGGEGILSLKPDSVFATHDAGPPAVLQQIAAAGVTVYQAGEGHSADALLARITMVAEPLGQTAKGDELGAHIRSALARIESLVGAQPSKPKVLFVLSARDGAPMAAGRKTAADAMISLAGGINVFSAHEGYKPLSLEAAAAAAPDAIVMMAHTLEGLGGQEGARQHPALRLTPAAQNGRIHAFDGQFLLGFGPRLPDAVAALAGALHPGLAL